MSGRLENDSFKLSELKLNLEGNMADNWFASYTEYQTHYAKIAEEEQCEWNRAMFEACKKSFPVCVGSNVL